MDLSTNQNPVTGPNIQPGLEPPQLTRQTNQLTSVAARLINFLADALPLFIMENQQLPNSNNSGYEGA